jgi:hypothetical protein
MIDKTAWDQTVKIASRPRTQDGETVLTKLLDRLHAHELARRSSSGVAVTAP